ncbi:signal transduction histidine kinase [Streptosporangium becharense]|uniref:histidine kinase n=1 Tax=Streptosporangium becharense TaxID=1816182 RepID=A0A7W9IIU8_9ACTN|nr:ATP-binding protein [Streptosporangium becharense]MBB2913953.1 signal transduction histidine kinase [Streptosporangium becharense]MBB5821386.1 signal transduction histidine kinase [Streptosporangium becharense]
MTSTARAGVLAASIAGVAAAGIVTGSLLETGLPVPFTQWLFIGMCLALPAVGWLIAARRPDNPYGWLLLVTALCLGMGGLGAGALLSAAVQGPPAVVAALLASLFHVFYGLSWVFVPLLFPDGRLPSRRWRTGARVAAAGIAVWWLGILLSPDQVYLPVFQRGNPLGFDGTAGLLAAAAGGLGQTTTFLVALAVLVSLVLRWRRGTPAERRLLRWMIAGSVVTLSGFVTLTFFEVPAQGTVTLVILVTQMAALPAVIAAAVFRHNLLDLRVGIRGSRFFLVFDLRPTVDELLTELGPALEEAEPVEQLGRLAEAVRASLEIRWAAVELTDGTRVVAGKEEGEAVLTVPAGPGSIVCGPRTAGRLTAEDRRLLSSFAVPIGLAIQSAALAGRLVNAQEAERRRIERNIHDGVQQQLVALIAGLELARATGGGPDSLALLREQARQTLTDLRELAAGIHPSVLSQGGLAEAIEERCSRLPVATTVAVDPGLRARRFRDEIEGAVYFTVSEAVANALKHAGASRIEVRLAEGTGRLRAEVSDDGRGFDPAVTARRGLGPLADRLTALGGGLDVSSEPGGGTRLRAWVPVAA